MTHEARPELMSQWKIRDAGGYGHLVDGRMIERKAGETVWRDVRTGEVVELLPSRETA